MDLLYCAPRQLQTDTVQAINFLTDFIQKIRTDRANSFFTEVMTDGKKLRLGDNWPEISVGGSPRDTIVQALGEGIALYVSSFQLTPVLHSRL